MRLTADTIAARGAYSSPLKDREIDLSGLQIAAIENLGATKDEAESIVLCDNSIQSLSNLPRLLRLRQLLLANNPVHSLSPSLASSLPNLAVLVLDHSGLKTLADLEPITALRRLQILSLRGSPVARAEHYRPWLAARCRHLRILDYERVKDKERKTGRKLFFDSQGNLTELATELGAREDHVTNDNNPATTAGRLLSDAEKERVRQAIASASNIDEVRRLQRMLADGFVP